MPDDPSFGYFSERALDPHGGTLRPAEIEVVRLLSHGYNIDMVAEQRVVSKETVRTQLAHAKASVSAKTPAHLVAIALRRGLIE